MKLLTVPSVALRLEPRTSPAADAVGDQHAEPRGGAAAAAVSEVMSLESSMTDGGRADVVRPRRPRRHRGADDVFPTRAIHRQQVCRMMLYVLFFNREIVVWGHETALCLKKRH